MEVSTTSSCPSPRRAYGIAVLGSNVVIHAGWDGSDLFFLSMKDLEWIRFKDSGKHRHSLTAISDKHILEVGGRFNDSFELSNSACILDIQRLIHDPNVKIQLPPHSLRTIMEPIPSSHFPGGLWNHQAVGVAKESGYAVICIGGFTNQSRSNHPNHMLVFDIE